MLNYLWGIMILIGVMVAAFTGKMPDVTNAALNSSKDSVQLCITMLGIMCMWTGLMKIAEKAGLIDTLSSKMMPLLKFLFPDIPKNHKAFKYIATNMIANMFGLGWAATPAGIMAMKEMQTLNKTKDVASKSMCMFMIVNMSSLQLVSVNIIAFRTQYESISPSEIIAPGLIATIVSTIVGVITVKICEKLVKD